MELLGVYSEELVEPLAKVLSNLGVKHALVVYGHDGLDELSVSSATTICEVRDGFQKTSVVTPEEFGFPRCDKAELVGGSPSDNAEITKNILSGKEKGAKRNAVILNSAASIHIAKPEISIADGIKTAADIIDSGTAYRQMELFVKGTRE
jgi:anthranilate phosphoribosyltransferase